MSQQFNPVSSPIEHGLTLLEAGAGTGKTYSLVRIIVRQLVEKSLDPSEIVTVTFTRAATAEIKSRLHDLISEVLRELKTSASEAQNDLAVHWLNEQNSEWIEDAKRKLSIALSAFDSIPIFTIDGFFQRLLKEYAFESNVLFSVELDPDETPLIHTALQDYWRQHVYPMRGDVLLNFQNNVDFNKAKNFLQEALRSSEITLDPEYAKSAIDLNSAYSTAWQSFVKVLQEHEEGLRSLIDSPPAGIKKSSTPFKKGTSAAFLEEVEAILAAPDQPVTSIPKLSYLRADTILNDSAFNKGKENTLRSEPIAALFHAIEELIGALPQHVSSAYYGEIYSFVKTRLRQLKSDLNSQSYNDVTATLASLLKGSSDSAKAIKSAIYKRYKAALIDEFQDTSPEQCSVFINLFKQEKRVASDERYFHIIGDPKQSIYRFRGADVFAYIEAAKNADHKFSLLTNYRSSPSMIHAVNKIFSASPNAFLVEGGITFTASDWTGKQSEVPPSASPALFFQSLEVEKVTAGQKTSIFFQDIARNIRQLLDTPWSEIDPHSGKEGRVQPSDFAILVRNKYQGESLNKLLNELNIPSTLSTRTSLLASSEASEILSIISALLEPRNTPSIRSALLTAAMGSGKLLSNDKDFDRISNNFSELHTLWNERGLMPTIQDFVARFSIRTTYLQLTHGQRRLTNFMHLAELLDSKARTEKLTPASTLQWLEMAIQGSIIDTDADQLELRIATDDAAVQILTQHTSKGLEYPIVFVLPSCKVAIEAGKLSHTYHQRDSGETRFAPFGDTEQDSFKIRKNEQQADSVRLAYVALTRAKSRCYFYYEPPNKKSPNDHAIYRMLGERDQQEIEQVCQSADNTIVYNPLTEDSLQQQIEAWTPPLAQQPPELCTRDLHRVHFTTAQRTTSFTGITRNAPDVLHDIDSSVSELGSIDDSSFWNQLQAGASLGLVFHEILEEIDFQDTSGLPERVANKLDKFSPWKEKPEEAEMAGIVAGITANIEQLMQHPMDDGFSLDQLTHQQRLNEAQFLLSGANFSLKTLCDVLESDPPKSLPAGYIDQLRELPDISAEGFLDGIIDLIFEHNGRYHILDWKTNKIPDNTEETLVEAMADHHYFLQYHLYSLALDQLLAQRLGDAYDPAQHLGACYYVFLRGVIGGSAKTGIFADTITPTRLKSLRQAFLTPQPASH